MKGNKALENTFLLLGLQVEPKRRIWVMNVNFYFSLLSWETTAATTDSHLEIVRSVQIPCNRWESHQKCVQLAGRARVYKGSIQQIKQAHTADISVCLLSSHFSSLCIRTFPYLYFQLRTGDSDIASRSPPPPPNCILMVS